VSERSRFLVVVSRRDSTLFDHLARGLAGTAGVEVVLDRRQEQRRKGGAQPDDRRRGERRLHPEPRFPALGSEVVRAGVERLTAERVTVDRVAADPVAVEERRAYRTLLWPSVRLEDVLPAPAPKL
jgi:hypothetical protein